MPTLVVDPVDDSDCQLAATGGKRLNAVVALRLARRDAYLGYHSL